MQFLEQPSRNLFFTGKGGVGKTSVACATAVKLADAGERVLLVSTDPASNLNEVLGIELGNHPTPLAAVPNLFAMNLDPEQSAAEYRERLIAPYRGILPDAAVTSMEEQLSGSCTLEIAAFDEFSRLLGDPQATAEFEHVIFDTAPTGHTLRLLTLPSAWDGFMEQNTTGTSCLGPLAGLQPQQQIYQETVAALSDPAATTLVLVARAEPSALQEAARTSHELIALGVKNQHLVINGVFSASNPEDRFAAALEARRQTALDNMPPALTAQPRTIIPLRPAGVMGVEALRTLFAAPTAPTAVDLTDLPAIETRPELPPLSELIDEITAPGHGVVMTMGKGGVGKTAVAAAIALAIAERGYAVQLSTTDPAAHLDATLADDSLPNLSVSRIDPAEETRRYSEEVMAGAGAGLDTQGRALLEEDLRSPCTEEIAVFQAFAKAVDEGKERFVVLDTAPTGHTILLLDATLAYHREVSRQTSQSSEAVTQLLPRLRDPDFTKIMIVTLPEATPVHEAAQLQRDLRRAEIEPFAWVVNQSLVPLSLSDPGMLQRQQHELRYLTEVNDEHAGRVALIAWQLAPPIGIAGLKQLLGTEYSIFPNVAEFVVDRIAEFAEIPQERKQLLTQLATYVRQQLHEGGPARMTFICTHNSRRSHLSQIWAKVAADHYRLGPVDTFSGGTEATAFNPRAVESLRRCGLRIDVEDPKADNPRYLVRFSENAGEMVCFSKVFNESPNPTRDYCAVMTCDQADEACPVVSGCELRVPVCYQDPKLADGTPNEAEVYDERSRQIAREMLFMMSQV